jgi:prepilin-type processing-associated H-X9-DG protein
VAFSREKIMSTAFATLVLFALSQVPATEAPDQRVKAIAPFVDSDVFAVVLVDVAALDVQQFSARVFGDPHAGILADGKRLATQWSQGLRASGAKELYVVFSIIDVPGQPLVIVPLVEASQAEGIARTIGAEPVPIHNAIVSGPPEALARIRRGPAAARPELSAAFGALAKNSAAVRLFILPSADSRRVLEEIVPRFPAEIGGGPITDLTNGLIWAAAGIDNAEKPAFKLVAASRDPEAAKSLVRLAENVVAFLRRSPEVLRAIPDLAKVLPEFKPVVVGNRVTLAVDAQQAVGLADALLSPARRAATRTQCVNNLKQIMLALHNYHSKHDKFPPQYSSSKDGKPLLSWRVLILPFVEQQALYDQFHLDEPWDSAHNRTLISKMPAVFRCPDERDGLAKDGKTRYLAPRSADTIMRGAEPVALREITDGTSNTIMVLDAGDDRAVEWTKPADWEFDPDPAVQTIFTSHEPNGTNMAFADGSVRFIRVTIQAATLRALFTRAGGEVIGADEF